MMFDRVVYINGWKDGNNYIYHTLNKEKKGKKRTVQGSTTTTFKYFCRLKRYYIETLKLNSLGAAEGF